MFCSNRGGRELRLGLCEVLFLVAQYLATLHASAYGSDTSLDQGLYSATLFVSFGANLAGTGFIAAKAWSVHIPHDGQDAHRLIGSTIARPAGHSRLSKGGRT